MLINTKSTIHDARKENRTASAKRPTESLFSFFTSELQAKQQHITQQQQQDIEKLKADLESAGELLEKEPTIKNFKQFRELLSKIAKQVSSEAYRLEKIGGTPANPRYYEIITVIDKEADKLYEMIVKGQKDRMAITESVIGIKGLVVDLIT